MAIGTTGALIASAAIAAASTAYATSEQKKAQKADQSRREEIARQEQEKADRIASETRPEEEGLGETKFGVDDDGTGGSTEDFLVPKTGSALGSSKSKRSGLGFAV